MVTSCAVCKVKVDIRKRVDAEGKGHYDGFHVQCDECKDGVCSSDCCAEWGECGPCEQYFGKHVCRKCCNSVRCPGVGWFTCEECADLLCGTDGEGCASNCLARIRSEADKKKQPAKGTSTNDTSSIKTEEAKVDLMSCVMCKVAISSKVDKNGEEIDTHFQCEECKDIACLKCYFNWNGCGPCEKYGCVEICRKCCNYRRCPGEGWFTCAQCAETLCGPTGTGCRSRCLARVRSEADRKQQKKLQKKRRRGYSGSSSSSGHLRRHGSDLGKTCTSIIV